MLEFMDYVQSAFYAGSRWNTDNSYASLTAATTNLLDFRTPHGVRLHVSSLSSPNFATSYTLGNRGVVDGSFSFLFSNLGVKVASRSSAVYLGHLVRGYRHLQELRKPEDTSAWETVVDGKVVQKRDALLYGRMYLPGSTLEALYLRRLSPSRLLSIRAVSGAQLPHGGTLLAQLQNDQGKYTTEYLCSTDSALLGFRGLYNFGYDPRGENSQLDSSAPAHPWDHKSGRLSVGAEAYFSPMNKSGGLSTGLRFTTLPVHTGIPYTMTLTLNPLMGNLSSSYAVKAGSDLSLCTRFDFNVYSYESDLTIGLELWRRESSTAWARKMLRSAWRNAPRPAGESAFVSSDFVMKQQDATGVVKARMSAAGKASLLWEGRVKELLVSVGAGFDMKSATRALGSVGLEVSYSS
ncbi:Mitochondrial distribution and morphology protein 10 [Oleoguttula sp. CCFEE 5521]